MRRSQTHWSVTHEALGKAEYSCGGQGTHTLSMKSALKRVVPEPLRPRLRQSLVRIRSLGWRRYCVICDSHLNAFMTHGEPPETDFRCPLCHSKPPHRLAAYYFRDHPGIYGEGGTMVHIAPESGLGPYLKRLAQRRGMRYRAGDVKGTGDAHLDLLALPFPDASIHMLYACHVLNSLQDDRAAMREVRRVLHPDGVAILQVPAFCTAQDTIETHGHEDRMRVFSDDGIYRCYTNADYENRLQLAGFAVECFRASSLPVELVRKAALKQELLHVCRAARS